MSKGKGISIAECNLKHESLNEMKLEVKQLVHSTTVLETTMTSLVENMKTFWEKEEKKGDMRMKHNGMLSSLKSQTGFQWWLIGVGFTASFTLIGWILKTIYILSQSLSKLQHLMK